jgi:serine/threonine protein phosphatase PrpC
MVKETHQTVWMSIGASVRGAAHSQAFPTVPNQDALRRWPATRDAVLPQILAVADGHGSPRCFRSRAGARIAVNTAVDVFRRFLQRHDDGEHRAQFDQEARTVLPEELVCEWLRRVKRHQQQQKHRDQFAQALMGLQQREGSDAARTVEARPEVAYGSTLLVIAVTHLHLLAFQIGDGDILTISPAGQVARLLPIDRYSLGNETVSLCTIGAARYARVAVQRLSLVSPALVLAATDGYSNSFADDTDFFQVGLDLLAAIREDTAERVANRLRRWLAATSHEGSGDDITLGIICREGSSVPVMTSQISSLAGSGAEGDESRGRSPALLGEAAMRRVLNVVIVLARCSQQGHSFGLRVEETARNYWNIDWAFAMKEAAAQREGYDRGKIKGTFRFDAAYPGCPFCKAPSIFSCGCGGVGCWDRSSRIVTCPWCDDTAELSSGNGDFGLNAGADR